MAHALGRAAAARKCNMDKMFADKIKVYRELEAEPFIVVESPEFAPFTADAERFGWQVPALPALPRVIPAAAGALTKGA